MISSPLSSGVKGTLFIAFLLARVLEAQTIPASLSWKFPTEGIIFSSPAMDRDGVLYVGSNDHNLWAINPDGTTKWKFPTENWVDSSPAVSRDGTQVYFGSWDNRLYAVNSSDGSLKWSFETNSYVTASPTVDKDGRIYFGSMDSFFYALESDGTLAWEYFVGQPVFSSAAIGQDGSIYFGDEAGSIHALQPNGSLKWTYEVDDVEDSNKSILSSPALDSSGNLYLGSGNGYCYSLSDEGLGASLNWKYRTGDRVDASPVLGLNGEVFFVSRDGYLRSLPTFSATTENLPNWEVFVGDVFYSTPVVDENGRVYVIGYTGGGENHLFAYDANGSKAWDSNVSSPPFEIPSVVDSSLLLSDDGRLYFGCFDQNLYSLSLGVSPANSGWPMFRRNSSRDGDWPSFSLTLQSSPAAGGSTTGVGQFYQGSSTIITASPNTGYSFNGWIGEGVNNSSASSTTVIMTSARNITASFSLKSYSLSVLSGTGGDANGSGTFTHGSSPIISAIPNSEYTFAGWTGEGVNDPSASTTTVSMTEDRNVSASFTLRKDDYFLLKLSTNISTAGIVRINDTGYEEFPKDSNISISASPSEGYSFERWSGEGITEPNSQDTTVWMTSDKNITAIFSLNSYLLSLTSNTGGSLSYSGSLLHGSYATIIATPNSGYSFLSWEGNGVTDLSASTSQVLMNQDRNVSANFTVSLSVGLGLEPSTWGSNWFSSWLGIFYKSSEYWVYHIDLGWLFLCFTETSLWLWTENHGWAWTAQEPFAGNFLWLEKMKEWVYLDLTSTHAPRYYNYQSESWVEW